MLDTILAGVVVLILAGIGRLIWCKQDPKAEPAD